MQLAYPQTASLSPFAVFFYFAVEGSVVKIDMTAYRPMTEGTAYGNPFQKQAITNSLEENPGAGIRVNGDDDNNNSTADCNDTTVSGENDLIEVELKAEPYPASGVTYVLKRSSSNIKVWNSQTKGTALLDSGTEAEITFSASTKTVWVENPNGGTADLEFIARAGENDVCSDKVHFYPFTSVIVVFGGETQDPIDPVPAGNRGVFRIATNLYAEGFDAHMYGEPDLGDNPNTEDEAFNEITNAVRSRSVTSVAIVGYSHGGGSTWNLADRLSALTPTINIDFTAYLDAVTQPLLNTTEENRRPPTSAFHVNYYQTNGVFELGGGPIDNPPGADFELDVETTEWGAALDHGTIDDHPNVLNGILTPLRAHISR